MSAKKTPRNNFGLYGLLALAAFGAGALTMYASRPQSSQVPPTEHRTDRESNHQQVDPAQQGGKVKVLHPVSKGAGEVGYEHSEKDVPQGADKYEYSIGEFIKESKIVPEGTKILSAKLDGSTLKVDFSKEIQSTGYSSEDEGTLINGIVKTAGQFPEVRMVLLTVEGQTLDSLGHIDLSVPQPVLQP